MKAIYGIIYHLVLLGALLLNHQVQAGVSDFNDDSQGQFVTVTYRNYVKNGKDYSLEKKRKIKKHVIRHHSPQRRKLPTRTVPKKPAVLSKKDGAPLGPLPTFFSKIFPKREPISRYGNPDVYEVMGKKYEVMTNSTGYKSRGIASWYGTKFHSGRTSSGEKYDMYALTAAHKTLPLPTYVKVKNLQNGREAIVKVNDRGPFHQNRILDLSYAAAVKLGMLPRGTALVEIEALKTTQKSLNYFLQAGAFESRDLAYDLRARIGRITNARVLVHHYNKKYIVQLGPLASKDMANRLKSHLAANHISGAFSLLM